MNTNPVYAYVLVGVLIVAVIAVIAWAQAQRRRKQSRRCASASAGIRRTVNEMGTAARPKRSWKRDKSASRDWTSCRSRLRKPRASIKPGLPRRPFRGRPQGGGDRGGPPRLRGHGETRVSDGRFRGTRRRHLRRSPGRRLQLSRSAGDRAGGRARQVDTELLRRAVVHYRSLFEELLEVREAPQPILRNGIPAA